MKKILVFLIFMECIICIFTVINSGVKVNGKEYLNNSLESVSLTNNELEIEFPELLNFLDVDKNLQSCDPSVYNFQMFARRNGLYFYFVQYLDVVINDNLDSWENTHVEMEIWQADFGYGWDGTYIALFLDNSVYINHTSNVRTYYLKTFIEENADITKIEYYFWIEFDNNIMNYEAPYSYVKQYQFIPNIDINDIPNSKIETRDTRTLITGYENSWQVHESIDKDMNS